MSELKREYTYSEGLFELNENHRMVKFMYPTEINMSIVNMDTETSISTSTEQDFFITLAKDGLVYVPGNYEYLASDKMAIGCSMYGSSIHLNHILKRQMNNLWELYTLVPPD
ncbi:MAG: hypothetical protein OXE59_05695 [Bacteroidetes bacterium]|nr:hypothetical protein [Bacteroidota bacterium]